MRASAVTAPDPHTQDTHSGMRPSPKPGLPGFEFEDQDGMEYSPIYLFVKA
jgi:hypothetical protein